jgi:thiamine-monophosphate kinase
LTTEPAFIAALRALASDPAARGFLDDAAVLGDLVLTHDMIVEGVHFLSADPPEDVAWKLLAVNLSDLAAKGATPAGVLMGYTLAGDEGWDQAFLAGLTHALSSFAVPLLGGDTVSVLPGTPRSLGLTAIGRAGPSVPARSGAAAGDHLWVTGTIGDAGAGLRVALGEVQGAPALVERYRRPQPRLEAGRLLASVASAMMDVSDGLLLDAARLAEASGVSATIDLAAVPLSAAYRTGFGSDRRARLDAAVAGDDYELLFAAPPERRSDILAISDSLGLPITLLGGLAEGSGVTLTEGGAPVPLPASLGWQHRSA